jgi:hypothetical protein
LTNPNGCHGIIERMPREDMWLVSCNRDLFRVASVQAAPGDKSDPPKALETEYPFKQIIVAAAIQGAIYSVVKTIIDRQGARAFERWTGEWPGLT